MTVLVTGGAGFIGANIVAALEAAGTRVVIADELGDGDHKWRNIARACPVDIVPPAELAEWLARHGGTLSGVVHMGAISATTERDVDRIVANNFRLSCDLWRFCAAAGLPFVYASSAATYGDGSAGFADASDAASLARLKPLNPYGWSKLLFDRWVRAAIDAGEPVPPRWAGLRFFNVYGPCEHHKGPQRSVAVQVYEQIARRGYVELFASDHAEYADGGQLRDFVWVGDCVEVARWALRAEGMASDIYNVGSGAPRAFRDIAAILFRLMQRPEDIRYADLPEALRGKYQYYTCADLTKLRAAGFTAPTTALEDGLARYHAALTAEGQP